MSKLLIDEYPLLVLPKLAKTIGLNEAIFLQQLHYWLTPDPARKYKPHYREWEGKLMPWAYNTYKQQEDETGWEANFPFWSARTIMRIVASLRKRNLIITTDKFNKIATDRTLWYTINYDELDKVEIANLSHSQPTMTDCQSHEGDNLSTGEGQPVTLLPETTSETPTKTNKEMAPEKFSLPPCSDAHQHHVDAANGSTAPDPAQVVAEHLHSGYMGAPVPLPSGKQERKKWIEAGRRLLRRFEDYDLRQLCYSVDCYWQNPDDFWRDKPCHDETLDLIARAYLQRQAAAPAPLPPPLPPSAPDPLAVAWGRVLDDLSTQTAAPTFKAHFAGSQLIARQNGDITVYLPNPDTLAWFKAKPSIENLLKQAVAAQMGDVRIAYTNKAGGDSHSGPLGARPVEMG